MKYYLETDIKTGAIIGCGKSLDDTFHAGQYECNLEQYLAPFNHLIVDGRIISKHPIILKKREKLGELEKSFLYSTNSFVSTALGLPFKYTLTESEKFHLHAIVANMDGEDFTTTLKCMSLELSEDLEKEHSVSQVKKVLKDYLFHRETCKKTFQNLKEKIEKASTVEEIETLTWSTLK